MIQVPAFDSPPEALSNFSISPIKASKALVMLVLEKALLSI